MSGLPTWVQRSQRQVCVRPQAPRQARRFVQAVLEASPPAASPVLLRVVLEGGAARLELAQVRLPCNSSKPSPSRAKLHRQLAGLRGAGSHRHAQRPRRVAWSHRREMPTPKARVFTWVDTARCVAVPRATMSGNPARSCSASRPPNGVQHDTSFHAGGRGKLCPCL